MLSIRRVEADDAAGIAVVNTRSWRAAYAGLMADEFLARWEVTTELWQQRLNGSDPRVSVFVATDDRRIVGFSAAGPIYDPDPSELADETVGHLYSLYVLSDYYGQGLGYRLHEAQLAAMGTSGFTSAMLWVLEGNRRAIEFYVRQGWVDDGTVRQEDWDGELLTEYQYRRPNLQT